MNKNFRSAVNLYEIMLAIFIFLNGSEFPTFFETFTFDLITKQQCPLVKYVLTNYTNGCLSLSNKVEKCLCIRFAYLFVCRCKL